jgi:hypothetical protein
MNFTSSFFADSRRNTARYAGLLYLLMAVTAAFSLLTMPSSIIVKGNATQTVQNLLAQEMTVRWVMLSHFASHGFFLLLVMTFYRLLKGVNDHAARLMVTFVAVQVPLIFVGEALNFCALLSAKGELLQSFSPPERADTIMLLLKIRSTLWIGAQVFWGLWLIPLGQLFYASGFMPRVLGITLIVGGVSYIVQSAYVLLFPVLNPMLITITNTPPSIAEISTILWLLIMGTTGKTSSSQP